MKSWLSVKALKGGEKHYLALATSSIVTISR